MINGHGNFLVFQLWKKIKDAKAFFSRTSESVWLKQKEFS